MNTILIYDTECNGLDTDHGHIMELAWAVYDIESKRLLFAKSRLIRWNLHYTVEPSAFLATGLSREFCEKHGRMASDVFAEFLVDCEGASFVGGHNILGFDHLIMRSNVRRVLYGEPTQLLRLTAIDTYLDCPYPPTQKIHALKYLALDHGFVMTNAHQAMADVFAAAHILFCYPFETCLKVAETPVVTIAAYTDYWDTAARERLYNQKFRWNRDAKRWEKRTRAYFVPGTQLELKLDLYQDDKLIELPKEKKLDEPSSHELPF